MWPMLVAQRQTGSVPKHGLVYCVAVGVGTSGSQLSPQDELRYLVSNQRDRPLPAQSPEINAWSRIPSVPLLLGISLEHVSPFKPGLVTVFIPFDPALC